MAKCAAHLNQGTAEVLEQGTKRLSHFVGVSTVLQMLTDTVNVKLDFSEKCCCYSTKILVIEHLYTELYMTIKFSLCFAFVPL